MKTQFYLFVFLVILLCLGCGETSRPKNLSVSNSTPLFNPLPGDSLSYDVEAMPSYYPDGIEYARTGRIYFPSATEMSMPFDVRLSVFNDTFPLVGSFTISSAFPPSMRIISTLYSDSAANFLPQGVIHYPRFAFLTSRNAFRLGTTYRLDTFIQQTNTNRTTIVQTDTFPRPVYQSKDVLWVGGFTHQYLINGIPQVYFSQIISSSPRFVRGTYRAIQVYPNCYVPATKNTRYMNPNFAFFEWLRQNMVLNTARASVCDVYLVEFDVEASVTTFNSTSIYTYPNPHPFRLRFQAYIYLNVRWQ